MAASWLKNNWRKILWEKHNLCPATFLKSSLLYIIRGMTNLHDVFFTFTNVHQTIQISLYKELILLWEAQQGHHIYDICFDWPNSLCTKLNEDTGKLGNDIFKFLWYRQALFNALGLQFIYPNEKYFDIT